MSNDSKLFRLAQVFGRWLGRRLGFFWRGFVCLMIGFLFLLNSRQGNFDTRLKFRGNQAKSTKIALITLHPNEIPKHQALLGSPAPLSEMVDVTDTFYWNIELWTRLMAKVLSANPRAVGITLVFGESLAPLSLSKDQKSLFYDTRVLWAGVTSANDNPIYPVFSKLDKSNVGSIDIARDEDGIARKLITQDEDFQPMVMKFSGRTSSEEQTQLINFRGDSRVFDEYSATDILTGQVKPEALKGKIILIGSEAGRQSLYLTPLGPSTRHTILAHMLDQLLEKRRIQLAPLWVYFLLLVLFVWLTILIMTKYPQSISFVFLAWILTLWAALSAWIFDSVYFWLPVSSVIVLVAAAYVIFLGYQANSIERQHYKLKQEQKYLRELEQLKNNFVSLISHDLKTPIAKIQAVLHRLQLQNQTPELSLDLKSLQESSEELSRYIQSILRMLRVESRDFRLHIEVGDINTIIEDVILQITPLAKEKNITLKAHLEPMFSSEFDHTLIREVLVNIVENAIKYTPQNGQITLHSQEKENMIYIDVTDTGEGIPEPEISQVWGKFVRGKDQDLKTKGTGLGLYLVKFFIELHGGKVALQSAVGKGTTISFCLPAEHHGNSQSS